MLPQRVPEMAALYAAFSSFQIRARYAARSLAASAASRALLSFALEEIRPEFGETLFAAHRSVLVGHVGSA